MNISNEQYKILKAIYKKYPYSAVAGEDHNELLLDLKDISKLFFAYKKLPFIRAYRYVNYLHHLGLVQTNDGIKYNLKMHQNSVPKYRVTQKGIDYIEARQKLFDRVAFVTSCVLLLGAVLVIYCITLYN